MIFKNSKLISADNTDIRLAKVIKVLGSSKKTRANIGELVRTTVAKRWQRKDIIKKKIYYSLIITIKKKTRRLNGCFIRFDQNRSLTFSEQFKFLGTRIYGPICKEIRSNKKRRVAYRRVISFSKLTL